MALKYQIDTLDGLDEATAALYVAKDGKFVLDTEGLPQPEDVSGLKANQKQLMDELKAERKARKEAEDKQQREHDDRSRQAGDVDALDKSWKAKYEAREAELTGEVETVRASLNNLMVRDRARALAGELALPGSEKVLLPHIERRLRLEMIDGVPTTVVVDDDGKRSAQTIDDLRKEIANDKAFAPMIRGSSASGGGANGGGNGGGAAKKLADYTEAERIELGKTNPEKLASLVADARKK